MNTDHALLMLQDFRSQLENWGVTPQTLIVTAGVATILLFFSLREVMNWYFRIYKVRAEIAALRAQLEVLQKTLTETRELLLKNTPAGMVEIDTTAAQPTNLLKVALKLNSSSDDSGEHETPVTLKKNNRVKMRFDH